MLIGNWALNVKSPINPPFQESGINTQLLVENNSFQGKSVIIWGFEMLIWEMAEKYQVEYDLLYNLAKCESELVHENKWGDKGRSFGLYQWQEKSWELYNKKFNLDLDIKNPKDQIELTAIVLKDGGWRNWYNCYRKYQVYADKI